MSDFFFFNDTATTEIYTLSLHDALPICWTSSNPELPLRASRAARFPLEELPDLLRGSRAVADRELDADGGDELAGVPHYRLGVSPRRDRGSAAVAHLVPVSGGGRLGRPRQSPAAADAGPDAGGRAGAGGRPAHVHRHRPRPSPD